jgi:hypothetical protein
VADTPFTATLSKGLGHAGKRACCHRFLLGQRKDKCGNDLGTTRFLGYAADTTAEPFQVRIGADGLEAEWTPLDNVCFHKDDGDFDEDILDRIRKQPLHMHVMVQTANGMVSWHRPLRSTPCKNAHQTCMIVTGNQVCITCLM